MNLLVRGGSFSGVGGISPASHCSGGAPSTNRRCYCADDFVVVLVPVEPVRVVEAVVIFAQSL